MNEFIFKRDGERIASLEARMDNLEFQYQEINNKLDSLIDLKNKGAGAFWLVSALFGTSFVMVISYFLNLFKSHS